jgi:small subunit ribosomal protein S19
MSRSKWKGNFIDQSVLKVSDNSKKQIKIWSRRSVIPSFLIGSTVLIYNGKEFKKVAITREKIGFKFGEFCTTRRYKSKSKK